MEDVTLSSLKQNCYSQKDFKIGERVRVYITYWGIWTDISVREGIVLDPDNKKKDYFWDSKVSSLRLKVEKTGKVRDRKPELKEAGYTRSYIYRSIGLVEKLDS